MADGNVWEANHPELEPELAHVFGDDSRSVIAALPGTAEQHAVPPDLRRAADTDKGHLRIEVRRIAVRSVFVRRLKPKSAREALPRSQIQHAWDTAPAGGGIYSVAYAPDRIIRVRVRQYM